MSPAAVDHANSTNVRRNSVGYSPRETIKTPNSPDGACSPQRFSRRLSVNFSPLLTALRTSCIVENLHTPPPKRIRPSSLYSPPPTAKFFKPDFVRNFNDWAGCNDQNSRDSGFESAASTSSSHRSTPVDQNDTADVVIVNNNASSSSKRQCRWDDCPNPDLDDGDELLEHILCVHVQPLETSAETRTTKTTLEKYACRWKDCKVYCKPSRLYAWLERHVVEKHAGPRPYGCPVPGCRQRFNGRSAAERHINSHFENASDVATIMTVSPTTTTAKNLHHETKRKSTSTPTTTSKIDVQQRLLLLKSWKSTSTVVPTVNGKNKTSNGNSNILTRIKTVDDDVGEPENNTCATKILAFPTTSTPTTTTTPTSTANKKRCHAFKSSLPVDALDDKFVRNVLAWHLSLSMTNERLISSTTAAASASTVTSPHSSCRKRNSGINHQHQKWSSSRWPAAAASTSSSSVSLLNGDADEITFQCKVLARRRRSDDGEFEFLVDWTPGGYLPSVWMPKNMYKSSFTVANSFVSRVRNSMNVNNNKHDELVC